MKDRKETPEEFAERMRFGSAIVAPSPEAVVHRLGVALELPVRTRVHLMDGRELAVIQSYEEIMGLMRDSSPDEVVELIVLAGGRVHRASVERCVIYGADEVTE
jgi:hypothetical protein